jgi:oligosaccharide repeat unit polymerase
MQINFLIPLIISEFLLLVISLRITNRDYISPSVVTCGMFLASSLCAFYNLEYWNVWLQWKTYSTIITGLIVIILTEILFISKTSFKRVGMTKKIIIDKRPIVISKIVLITVSLLTILLTVIYVREVQYLGGSGFTAIALVKHNKDLVLSNLAKVALRICRVIPYPCIYIIAYNVILCGEKVKKNWLLFIPIISNFVVIFFSGSRGPYLYIILSTTIYIFSFDRYKNRKRKIDFIKYLIPLFTALMLFIIIFVGTRSLVKGKDYSSGFVEYVTFYFGSPIHLFSKIINNLSMGFPVHYSMFGANTFAVFYEELYNLGLVNESIHLNQTAFIAIGGSVSGGGNVFTAFASPLNDFGYVGLLIYLVILYSVFDYFYYNKLKYGLASHVTLLVYGYFFFMIFMTFYVTTTVYIKLQTIVEVIIMIVIFNCLSKMKIRLGLIN